MITLENYDGTITQSHINQAHSLLRSMFSDEMKAKLDSVLGQEGELLKTNLTKLHGLATQQGFTTTPSTDVDFIQSAHNTAKTLKPLSTLTVWNDKGENITKNPPSPSDVLSTWENAIKDSILFVINLTALGSLASKGTKFEFKVGESKASKMEKMLDEITSAVGSHKGKISVASWFKAMKAIVKFLFTVLKDGIKTMIEAIHKHCSPWEWVLHGIVAVAQIAIWFATEGLALICQLVIAVSSGVSMVEAWQGVQGSANDFLTDLFNSGGEIHGGSSVRVIKEDFNPALVTYEDVIFRFQKYQSSGIAYTWIKSDDLKKLVSVNKSIEEQAAKIQSRDYSELTIDLGDIPQWSILIPISTITNNSSSPAAIIDKSKVNQLVVAYRSNSAKGYHWFTQIAIDNLYKQLVYNEDDFALSEWSQPTLLDFAWGPTAPNLSYTNINAGIYNIPSLIYQGENGFIWIAYWNGAGFDYAFELDHGSTATTPTSIGANNYHMMVFHTSSKENDFLWMNASLAGGDDEQFRSLPMSVNSKSSPSFAANWDGFTGVNLIDDMKATLYYLGTEDSMTPIVWKHVMPVNSLERLIGWTADDEKIFLANPQKEWKDEAKNIAYTSLSSPRFAIDKTGTDVYMFISNAPGVYEVVPITLEQPQ